MINYKEFIKESWQTAEEKGFHEGSQDFKNYIDSKLLLIISEIGEAVEAHRAGKCADLVEFESLRQNLLDVADIYFDNDPEKVFESAFRDKIKDRYEDEIADAYIRLADLAGIAGIKDIKIVAGGQQSENKSLPSVINDFLSWIITGLRLSLKDRQEDKKSIEASFQIAFRLLDRIVRVLPFDIERHIQLKMRYNKTRPHKHGKAY